MYDNHWKIKAVSDLNNLYRDWFQETSKASSIFQGFFEDLLLECTKFLQEVLRLWYFPVQGSSLRTDTSGNIGLRDNSQLNLKVPEKTYWSGLINFFFNEKSTEGREYCVTAFKRWFFIVFAWYGIRIWNEILKKYKNLFIVFPPASALIRKPMFFHNQINCALITLAKSSYH